MHTQSRHIVNLKSGSVISNDDGGNFVVFYAPPRFAKHINNSYLRCRNEARVELSSSTIVALIKDFMMMPILML